MGSITNKVGMNETIKNLANDLSEHKEVCKIAKSIIKSDNLKEAYEQIKLEIISEIEQERKRLLKEKQKHCSHIYVENIDGKDKSSSFKCNCILCGRKYRMSFSKGKSVVLEIHPLHTIEEFESLAFIADIIKSKEEQSIEKSLFINQILDEYNKKKDLVRSLRFKKN